MKVLAIAAVAATFWLLVATIRLLVRTTPARADVAGESCKPAARHRVKGRVMVDVRIARSGRVSSAVVTTGTFARTPTGTCVAQAVRTAHFPRSDGRSRPYPFQLR